MLRSCPRAARALAAVLVLGASACGLTQPPLPGPFTRDDVAELTDSGDGAQTRAQYLYHYLKKDRDPRLKIPAWVDAERPALDRATYSDPDGEVLTEAQLWQAPLAVLYEFYEITRKTFPPAYGGTLAKPETLAAEYRDNSERMKMCVERLRALHLEGSLGGRGRAALDHLEKISADIDGLAGTLAARDDSRFKTSALAIAEQTGALYRVFQN